jgi:dipeptidyl aminopeptidase/acylaminoacyl peptidase
MTIGEGIENKGSSLGCYTWHPNLDILVYVKDSKLYLVEFTDNDLPIIKQIYENPDVDLIAGPLLFGQDGTCVIVGANARWDSDHLKPESLLIIPLDQKQTIKEIKLQGKWHYISVLKADDCQIWQPEKSSLTTLLEDCDSGETVIIKFNLDQINNYDLLWKGQAKITGFLSKPGMLDIFFQYEDFNNPSNLYKANSDFSQLDCLSSLDLRAESLKFSTREVFETLVPLYNGELRKVRTTILLPPGKKQGDCLPGIVIFYPGAEASRYARRFSGGDLVTIPNFLFLDRGYALILPDIILGPEGVSGNPVQEIADILLPQVYQAAYLGYIDIARVGVIGQSYGGYGTTATISKTNLFRSAVAISGVYDLAGSYGYFNDDLTFFNIHWSEYGQGRMGSHPWHNLLGYLNNSPYYLADKIHTPLMLIHGEEDETCNIQEARKLFSALRRLEREVYLAIYPGQGHVIRDWVRSHAVDAAQRILNFFDDHLKRDNE